MRHRYDLLLLVSTSSGFLLSNGIAGICDIVFVHVLKNTILGCSVNSSICSLLCISFLPATRLPLLLSDGLHRHPRCIICSQEKDQYLHVYAKENCPKHHILYFRHRTSSSFIISAKSVARTLLTYNSLYIISLFTWRNSKPQHPTIRTITVVTSTKFNPISWNIKRFNNVNIPIKLRESKTFFNIPITFKQLLSLVFREERSIAS